MINIHIYWLPLIISVILWLIAWILNGFTINQINNEVGFLFIIISGFISLISCLTYIVLGLFWIYQHVNIIT